MDNFQTTLKTISNSITSIRPKYDSNGNCGFDSCFIEIQITNEADYDKRALYYWAKLYIEQLQTREEHSTLAKAIGIHILYFLSIPNVDKYHNLFHITEKDTGVRYFKDLELHTIELKKFCPNMQENLTDGNLSAKETRRRWFCSR